MIRTLIALVISAAVLTGGPVSAGPRDPAPGVRAPGNGRLIAPADVEPAKYGSAPRPGAGGGVTSVPDQPRSNLTLTYLSDAGFATAVKLTCEPAGGGHPKAAAACAALDRVGADPDRITATTTDCILIYSPLTAEITGTWHGTPVNWKHRYGNSCEMHRATAVLFEF